jgi:RHS repeat-associated protein
MSRLCVYIEIGLVLACVTGQPAAPACDAKGNMVVNDRGYGKTTVCGPDGDADGDGDVDLKDFWEFQAAFGDTGGYGIFDFNNDGHVNLADYTRFAAALGGPVPAGPVQNPFGFTGQRMERLDNGQLVLYDYKARVYDPVLGRFLQRDPVEVADQYNLYEYVKGRPTVATDPSGRFGLAGLTVSGALMGALFGGIGGAIGNPGARLQGALFGAISGSLAGGAGGVSAFLFSGYGLLGALAVGGVSGSVGGVSNALLEGDRDLASLAVDAAVGAGVGAVTGATVYWAGPALRNLFRGLGQRGVAVLGKFPEYVGVADELGAYRFNIPTDIWQRMTPAEQWAANVKFLDGVIARGYKIVLSNPVKDISKVTGTFRKELDYLIQRGFRLSDDGTSMIR